MTGGRRREDVAGGGNSLQRAAYPSPRAAGPPRSLRGERTSAVKGNVFPDTLQVPWSISVEKSHGDCPPRATRKPLPVVHDIPSQVAIQPIAAVDEASHTLYVDAHIGFQGRGM